MAAVVEKAVVNQWRRDLSAGTDDDGDDGEASLFSVCQLSEGDESEDDAVYRELRMVEIEVVVGVVVEGI